MDGWINGIYKWMDGGMDITKEMDGWDVWMDVWMYHVWIDV